MNSWEATDWLTQKYRQHTIPMVSSQSAVLSKKMKFGQRIRNLRTAASLTQREVATRLGVSVTYISKVENEKLHFGDYPSEKFIHRLAGVLQADESELMLLAGKMPEQIKLRVVQRPDVFLALAGCDDAALDKIKVQVVTLMRRGRKGKPRKPR